MERKRSLPSRVSESDKIEIVDHTSPTYRYILYNKPRGVITHSPEAHEVDIVTRVKKTIVLLEYFPWDDSIRIQKVLSSSLTMGA
jgi:16S rRNA U516 pseudouridylate synthase RsuA-like enzyme